MLAWILAAVEIVAGMLTFGGKVRSLRHTGAFLKASARLYKVITSNFHVPVRLISSNQVNAGIHCCLMNQYLQQHLLLFNY